MADSKWFRELNRRLQLSEKDITKTEIILNEISEIINFEYYNKRIADNYAFLTGSLSRGTAISLATADIMVILPMYMLKRYSLQSDRGPFMLIEDVYKKIKKNFIYTRISKDGNIVLDYEGIRFNILPAFKIEDNSYIYPDLSENCWVNLDIEKSLELFDLRDRENNGNMRNFSKMLKVWNLKNNINLSEVIIDSMVYEFFENYNFGKIKGFNYYDYYFYDFFKYILNKGVEYYWYIPGTSLTVKPRSPYLFNKQVKESLNTVKDAMDLYIKKYPHLAKEKWESILGDL